MADEKKTPSELERAPSASQLGGYSILSNDPAEMAKTIWLVLAVLLTIVSFVLGYLLGFNPGFLGELTITKGEASFITGILTLAAGIIPAGYRYLKSLKTAAAEQSTTLKLTGLPIAVGICTAIFAVCYVAFADTLVFNGAYAAAAFATGFLAGFVIIAPLTEWLANSVMAKFNKTAKALAIFSPFIFLVAIIATDKTVVGSFLWANPVLAIIPLAMVFLAAFYGAFGSSGEKKVAANLLDAPHEDNAQVASSEMMHTCFLLEKAELFQDYNNVNTPPTLLQAAVIKTFLLGEDPWEEKPINPDNSGQLWQEQRTENIRQYGIALWKIWGSDHNIVEVDYPGIENMFRVLAAYSKFDLPSLGWKQANWTELHDDCYFAPFQQHAPQARSQTFVDSFAFRTENPGRSFAATIVLEGNDAKAASPAVATPARHQRSTPLTGPPVPATAQRTLHLSPVETSRPQSAPPGTEHKRNGAPFPPHQQPFDELATDEQLKQTDAFLYEINHLPPVQNYVEPLPELTGLTATTGLPVAEDQGTKVGNTTPSPAPVSAEIKAEQKRAAAGQISEQRQQVRKKGRQERAEELIKQLEPEVRGFIRHFQNPVQGQPTEEQQKILAVLTGAQLSELYALAIWEIAKDTRLESLELQGSIRNLAVAVNGYAEANKVPGFSKARRTYIKITPNAKISPLKEGIAVVVPPRPELTLSSPVGSPAKNPAALESPTLAATRAVPPLTPHQLNLQDAKTPAGQNAVPKNDEHGKSPEEKNAEIKAALEQIKEEPGRKTTPTAGKNANDAHHTESGTKLEEQDDNNHKGLLRSDAFSFGETPDKAAVATNDSPPSSPLPSPLFPEQLLAGTLPKGDEYVLPKGVAALTLTPRSSNAPAPLEESQSIGALVATVDRVAADTSILGGQENAAPRARSGDKSKSVLPQEQKHVHFDVPVALTPQATSDGRPAAGSLGQRSSQGSEQPEIKAARALGIDFDGESSDGEDPKTPKTNRSSTFSRQSTGLSMGSADSADVAVIHDELAEQKAQSNEMNNLQRAHTDSVPDDVWQCPRVNADLSVLAAAPLGPAKPAAATGDQASPARSEEAPRTPPRQPAGNGNGPSADELRDPLSDNHFGDFEADVEDYRRDHRDVMPSSDWYRQNNWKWSPALQERLQKDRQSPAAADSKQQLAALALEDKQTDKPANQLKKPDASEEAWDQFCQEAEEYRATHGEYPSIDDSWWSEKGWRAHEVYLLGLLGLPEAGQQEQPESSTAAAMPANGNNAPVADATAMSVPAGRGRSATELLAEMEQLDQGGAAGLESDDEETQEQRANAEKTAAAAQWQPVARSENPKQAAARRSSASELDLEGRFSTEELATDPATEQQSQLPFNAALGGNNGQTTITLNDPSLDEFAAKFEDHVAEFRRGPMGSSIPDKAWFFKNHWVHNRGSVAKLMALLRQPLLAGDQKSPARSGEVPASANLAADTKQHAAEVALPQDREPLYKLKEGKWFEFKNEKWVASDGSVLAVSPSDSDGHGPAFDEELSVATAEPAAVPKDQKQGHSQKQALNWPAVFGMEQLAAVEEEAGSEVEDDATAAAAAEEAEDETDHAANAASNPQAFATPSPAKKTQPGSIGTPKIESAEHTPSRSGQSSPEPEEADPQQLAVDPAEPAPTHGAAVVIETPGKPEQKSPANPKASFTHVGVVASLANGKIGHKADHAVAGNGQAFLTPKPVQKPVAGSGGTPKVQSADHTPEIKSAPPSDGSTPKINSADPVTPDVLSAPPSQGSHSAAPSGRTSPVGLLNFDTEVEETASGDEADHQAPESPPAVVKLAPLYEHESAPDEAEAVAAAAAESKQLSPPPSATVGGGNVFMTPPKAKGPSQQPGSGGSEPHIASAQGSPASPDSTTGGSVDTP